MKKVYLLAACCLIVGALIIVSAAGETSTYATFADAEQTESVVKVVGELDRERPIVYDPQVNPNYFSFYISDADGISRKVVLTQAKPQDFELSEQIVVTGRHQQGLFVASDVLLKCPSKYKDEMIALKADS